MKVESLTTITDNNITIVQGEECKVIKVVDLTNLKGLCFVIIENSISNIITISIDSYKLFFKQINTQ